MYNVVSVTISNMLFGDVACLQRNKHHYVSQEISSAKSLKAHGVWPIKYRNLHTKSSPL